MRDLITELAAEIAADLFTCGPRDDPDGSEHAERLVLRIDTENRNLGGWSEGPVRDRIADMMRKRGVTVSKPG